MPADGLPEGCLPLGIAEAIDSRLRACQEFPRTCQIRIDKCERVCLARIGEAVDVERADSLADRVSTPNTPREIWKIVAVVVVASLAAGAAGFGAGAIFGGR